MELGLELRFLLPESSELQTGGVEEGVEVSRTPALQGVPSQSPHLLFTELLQNTGKQQLSSPSFKQRNQDTGRAVA